ncbi:hypothetical protein [Zobellia nedashkovskayae]|uniref:hypothetical protein n=1 Tax=Zobellia nedashkovskayae TaxID=2779510 RepID=UPI00188D6198|nr:hypothetical protein [Zobellia nedashkovskayae]
MAEKAKYTLFRFAQLRNAQQISEENKKLFFIYHPDGKTSPFFDAIKGVHNYKDKIEKLMQTAEGFKDFESLQDLKDFKTDLYQFAVWLATNSGTLNETDVKDRILGIIPLKKAEKEKIWNNLFDQCLLQDDPYLRDACMELLVASHFLYNYKDIDKDDSSLRALASSTIVLPKKMFDFKKGLPTNEEANLERTSKVNKTVLKNQMQLAENKLNSNILTQAWEELNVAETIYHKSNETAYMAAVISARQESANSTTQGTHESVNLQMDPEAATKKQISFEGNMENDPDNSESQDVQGTQTLYQGPTVNTTSQTLNFTPAAQIELTNLRRELSQESMQVLTENNLIEKETFSDIQNSVLELNKFKTQELFESTHFYSLSTDIMGIPIPQQDLSPNVDYSFYIKPYKKSSKNYALLLVLNSANLGEGIVELNYKAKLPPEQSFSNYESTFANELLTINLTPNIGLVVADNKQKLEIQGSIEFDNGAILTWDVKLDMRNGTFGIMQLEDTQSSEVFVPNGFGITRLGIAEYRKVEQSLCCYVAGEVSHIENVMAREYKERSTRRLRKSDITTTSSEDIEQESLTDTSTTSRFDMQKEVSEVLSEQRQFGINANFHADSTFGKKNVASSTVSLDVGANYSQNKSKEKSKNEAINLSKDITQKATDRLTSKVKTERVKKIVEEFEEQNRHGFDNREGDKHISGVYRWVDKIYKNEIHNYGKRLTYEFQIPEPARFHFLAKQTSAKIGKMTINKPKNPKTDDFGLLGRLKSPKDITETNYLLWASQYEVEVSLLPAKYLTVGESLVATQMVSSIEKNVPIPEGYGLVKAIVGAKCVEYRDVHYTCSVGVAGICEFIGHEKNNHTLITEGSVNDFSYYENSIPISATFFNAHNGFVTVSLVLKRKQEYYEQWQLETYNAIMEAFNERMKDYEDAKAQAEVKQGVVMGTNPAFYQEIINTVLKKNCIDYLIGSNNIGQGYIFSDGSMQGLKVKNTQEMDKYASLVKFIEQAFEWNIMSYVFYPFYWAGKNEWNRMYNYDNNNKQFQEFMQSGMARVVVTVRPNFEKAVQWYIQTGQIWNGLEQPIFDDELYVSTTDELNHPEYDLEGTWETREPSTLTLIQSDTISLEASGLPCYCDDEKPPKEIIKQSTALDDLNVQINGKTD